MKISRDEITAALTHYRAFEKAQRENPANEELAEYTRTAVRALEFCQKSGWIPIEKKLPEPDKYILISFENYTMADIGRYEEDEKGGAFYPGDEETSYSRYGIVVNAWMPLPVPYEEGIRE